MNGTRDLVEAGVTAEEFISAEAAEGYLEPELAGEFCNEVRVDAVDGGLIHGIEEIFAVGDKVGAIDVLEIVMDVEGVGYFFGERDFVEGCIAHFVEAQGERTDVFSGELGSKRCDGPGVTPCREERCDGDIGAEVHGEGFDQETVEAVEHFLTSRRRDFLALLIQISEGDTVGPNLRWLTALDLQHGTCGEGSDSAVEGVGFGNVSPEVEAGMAGGIGCEIDAGNIAKGFDLRGEGEER